MRNIKIRWIVIILLIFSGLTISYIYKNSSNGWIFLKINNQVYVANSLQMYDKINSKQISATNNTQLPFIKPITNSASNILPYGIPIYEGENENEIYIEVNEKYLKMISINSSNWQSGIKITIDDLNFNSIKK